MQRALATIAVESLSAEEWVKLVLEAGEFGVKTMALLAAAYTGTYGNPEITKVNIGVKNRPGILISGHDLKDMEELLQHPKIIGLFRARIDTLQQQFAHYEQVKRFTLLPEPFSMERGELTNTLKLKRPVVAKNYKEVIAKMYEESW